MVSDMINPLWFTASTSKFNKILEDDFSSKNAKLSQRWLKDFFKLLIIDITHAFQNNHILLRVWSTVNNINLINLNY